MRQLPKTEDPRLLVGFDKSDDAAVYQIDESTALIQTVDIFPPIVDDPYLYGQIAAANALSDVYAMGGTPKLAMNILCIPEDLDNAIVSEILKGGYSKCAEAEAIVCGGHTIKDKEPKFGLCVSGFVDPSRVLKNSGAKEGDALILTKALGTGIITTALKGEFLEESSAEDAFKSMASLNREAALMMSDFPVNACTDVTGFGLIGHSCEMAQGSGVTIILDSDKIPFLPHAIEMAEMGMIPGGAYRNRESMNCHVSIEESVPLALSDVLYDPQTSGGLLISLPEKYADELLERLKKTIPAAAVIGHVVSEKEKSVIVR